jgi:hypothetical protein
MITYTAKSSVVSVSGSPMLVVEQNRDRVGLKLRPSDASIVFGGSDVSASNGYKELDGGGHVIALHFEGDASKGAVYAIFSGGTASVSVLEVVPDL